MAGFKRRMFYVGGFDPRGVRHYHQMMRDEVARYAGKTGDSIEVTRRRSVSPIRADWTIDNATNGATTEFSFLRWEDIVQRAWIKSPVTLAKRAARAYSHYLKFLDIAAIKKLATGPLITLFYPPILAILIPLVIALVVFGLGAILLPWWAALIAGIVAAAIASRPLLVKIHAPWLLRFFVFNSELSEGVGREEIEARLDLFAAEIAAALDGDHDEVLLVTHSNGSILAIPLMVKLLALRGHVLPEKFVLVTLGHCIPLFGKRRDATWFHDQLREVARHDFRWIDIGSPPDGAAFFGVNPMLLVGDESRPRIELLSPRFHLFYDPATYHKGYANKYEIHFDYLRVGDRVSPIDYPSLIAGDRPIEASVAAFKAI